MTKIINSNIDICRKNNSYITKKAKKYDLENKNINIDKNHEKNKNENFKINRNCTFHPNTRGINSNNSNLSKKNFSFDKNNLNVFERLSKKSERKKQDIENLKHELNKENIFQPNIHKVNSKALKRENFEERLKILEESKKSKEQKRMPAKLLQALPFHLFVCKNRISVSASPSFHLLYMYPPAVR